MARINYKIVGALVSVMVLYSLSSYIQPSVVYVDRQTNEIISDIDASKLKSGAENVFDDKKAAMVGVKESEPIKSNDKEEAQANIQIQEGHHGDEEDRKNTVAEPDSKKGDNHKNVETPQDEAAKYSEFSELKSSTPGTSSSSVKSPKKRVKATFVTLARNSELYKLIDSIRNVEDRFNRKFNYDWVFLNDEPFTQEFKDLTSSIVSGTSKYGEIPKEHWSYPEWIDQNRAAQVRDDMRAKKIIYGDLESYRHMCRFESGFFYRHPLLDEYKWYWRVEPDIKIHCDLDYDLFKYMEDNNKVYGFTVSIHEFLATIPTLWDEVKKFISQNPQYIAEDNLMDWISNDKGDTYNLCHFWSNFEIASLDFWRSEAYSKYFDHLDRAGGFFYERWGDAPIHSIAAALFLSKDKIHYFDDVGYKHSVYTQCPLNPQFRHDHKCSCNPEDDFTFRGYSCSKQYYDVMDIPKPVEWEQYT